VGLPRRKSEQRERVKKNYGASKRKEKAIGSDRTPAKTKPVLLKRVRHAKRKRKASWEEKLSSRRKRKRPCSGRPKGKKAAWKGHVFPEGGVDREK